MIDATKLLGGLLNGSLISPPGRRDGPGGGILPGKAAIGMGLLGVAIAAYEHFTADSGKPSAPPGNPPGSRPSAPPPPPPPSYGDRPGPPEAPRPDCGAAPPPPPLPTPSATRDQGDPTLLIRAMITAAHADGMLDADERERIVSRLESAGITGEEGDFLRRELDSPRPLAEIVAAVHSPAIAAQVFAVSLLSVEVDTEAEKAYLEELRRALGIDPTEAEAIARRMGR